MKVRIAILLLLGSLAIVFTIGITRPPTFEELDRRNKALEDAAVKEALADVARQITPQFEWQAYPEQTFTVEQGAERRFHFTATESKSVFTVRSDSPVDFKLLMDGDTICEMPQTLQTTLTCPLHKGEVIISFSDRRTAGDSFVRAAIGGLTRSTKTLDQLSPATVTMNAKFWRCVRNCAP